MSSKTKALRFRSLPPPPQTELASGPRLGSISGLLGAKCCRKAAQSMRFRGLRPMPPTPFEVEVVRLQAAGSKAACGKLHTARQAVKCGPANCRLKGCRKEAPRLQATSCALQTARGHAWAHAAGATASSSGKDAKTLLLHFGSQKSLSPKSGPSAVSK